MAMSPVIVYGALRSGTTLLRLMLDRNEGLICSGEADYLFDHLNISENEVVTLDREALRRDRIFKSSSLQVNNDLADRDAVCDMVEQLSRSSQKQVVLMIHRGLEKAITVFPDARILHMLRDPRDVAKSSIGMGWAGNVFHGVEHWLGTEREWDKVASSGKIRHCRELKYESLIENTEPELNRVCGFFGVKFSDNMLTYNENSTYSTPDPTLTQQWKRKLSKNEIGLVEGRVGGMLQNRAYEPSGYGSIIPSKFQSLIILLYNKFFIWRNRINKFGIVDPLTPSAAFHPYPLDVDVVSYPLCAHRESG